MSIDDFNTQEKTHADQQGIQWRSSSQNNEQRN